MIRRYVRVHFTGWSYGVLRPQIESPYKIQPNKHQIRVDPDWIVEFACELDGFDSETSEEMIEHLKQYEEIDFGTLQNLYFSHQIISYTKIKEQMKKHWTNDLLEKIDEKIQEFSQKLNLVDGDPNA